MKRYLLFVGERYYPKGGMRDFACDFDSIERAKFFIGPAQDFFEDSSSWWEGQPLPTPILERIPTVFKKMNDDMWAHIYDTQKMEFVFDVYGD